MKMAMARRMAPGMKKGGETKAMMKKEVAFMKKKGAPKSMLRHEMKEAGMKKMAGGGMTSSYRRAADGVASKGKTKGKIVRMNYGGKC
jgi:FKBP-type peptidyl-prolyl cis-trans isomerase